MCGVETALVIGLGSTIASTAMGATAAADEQRAANRAADYEAAVADANAKSARAQARDVERAGIAEANRQRIQASLLTGTQRAAAAGSGVSADQGSSLAIQESTLAMGEQDAQTIEANALAEAYAVRREAQNFAARAAFARQKKADPGRAALPHLLSGMSQLAGQFAGYQQYKEGVGQRKALLDQLRKI
jgi:hypothetical protein